LRFIGIEPFTDVERRAVFDADFFYLLSAGECFYAFISFTYGVWLET